MKRSLFAFAIAALMAAPAMAGTADLSADMGIPMDLKDSAPHSRAAGNEIYQNLSLSGVFSGQGLNQWIIDDMGLDFTLSGGSTILDTVTFSIYYDGGAATGSSIDTLELQVGFWADDGVNTPGTATTALLGGFGYTLNWGAGSGLTPGQYTTVTFNNVGLDLTGLSGIMAGTQYLSATGTGSFDPTKLGQVIAGTPTIGSSYDLFYYEANTPYDLPNGDGNWANFGGDTGDPLGNFMWEMTTVPEPSTIVLLGMGALALIRRRR